MMSLGWRSVESSVSRITLIVIVLPAVSPLPEGKDTSCYENWNSILGLPNRNIVEQSCQSTKFNQQKGCLVDAGDDGRF